MKRKFLAIVVLSLLLLFIPFHHAFAHFAKSDGNMTVIFHVDPDDNPTPGQLAHLYFLFDDGSKQFNIDSCTCIVSVSEGAKQMFSQELIQPKQNTPSVWGTSMSYVFPKRDVYAISLSGNPKTGGAFQPFHMIWYFRVDPDSPGLTTQPQSDIPIIIAVLTGGIIFLMLFGMLIKKEILDGEKVDKKKKETYNKKK